MQLITFLSGNLTMRSWEYIIQRDTGVYVNTSAKECVHRPGFHISMLCAHTFPHMWPLSLLFPPQNSHSLTSVSDVFFGNFLRQSGRVDFCDINLSGLGIQKQRSTYKIYLWLIMFHNSAIGNNRVLFMTARSDCFLISLSIYAAQV